MCDYEKVNYIDKGLKKYETDILTLGLCNAFFPVSFVEEKSKIKGIFDCRGYERLSECKHLDGDSCLQMVINMLENIYQTEKHCIFAEEVDLREEHCYINNETKDVKFLYIRDSSRTEMKEKFLRLMKSFMERLEESDRKIFARAVETVEKSGGRKFITGYMESLRCEFYREN